MNIRVVKLRNKFLRFLVGIGVRKAVHKDIACKGCIYFDECLHPCKWNLKFEMLHMDNYQTHDYEKSACIGCLQEASCKRVHEDGLPYPTKKEAGCAESFDDTMEEIYLDYLDEHSNN